MGGTAEDDDSEPAASADEDELVDRRVGQLLNDLRNTLLGVQILLAGLVTVAFTPAFPGASSAVRAAYLVAVLSAALASVLLIAPVQYHRVRWHHEPRQETLRVGRHLATAGSVALAVAVVTIVSMLASAVHESFAVPVAIGLAALIVALWFAVPLVGRPAAPEKQRPRS